MNKRILYIDMDQVVVDFDAGMLLHHPNLNDITDSALRDSIIDNICAVNRNIFETLPPIHGAIEAVTELFLHFEVYFLSTPMWSLPESFTGKRLWVEKHFGKLATKRLILSHRKDLNIGDFLVDDRIANGSGKFTGEHIHFGQEKFPNWEVTKKYLLAQVGITKLI
jgi:5'(3')-deoxyribonucleotidase